MPSLSCSSEPLYRAEFLESLAKRTRKVLEGHRVDRGWHEQDYWFVSALDLSWRPGRHPRTVRDSGDPTGIDVIYGNNDYRRGKIVRVKKWIRHFKYNDRTLAQDIAVLLASTAAASAISLTAAVAFTAMNGEQSPAGSARLLVPVPITLSLSSAPEPSPATLPPAAELNACRQQQFLLNRKISCDAMEPTNARIADQLPNSAIQPTQVRMDTTTSVQTNNLSGPASNAPELPAAQMMDITAPPLTSTHHRYNLLPSNQRTLMPRTAQCNNRIGDSNSAPTTTPHFQPVWSSRAAEADNRPWQKQRKRTKIQASSLNTPPQPVTRTRQTVLLRPAERFAVSEIPHGALQDGVMAIGGPQTQDYRIHIQPEANLIAIDAWNPSLIPRFLGLTTIQDRVRNFAFRPYEATPPDHARGIFHGFDVKDDGSTLLAQITCRTHKPVAARPLHSQGRSVLVTFAGPTLPRFITYRLHHKQITPFRGDGRHPLPPTWTHPRRMPG
ncbi:hypothetical protein HPB49_012528 [Dermacentor silvarum]|uniref:Uncharacterized protein n=1 Tax=Dermacentor silvarum TaxID=543639 RepID=A0ACB8C3L9_DERSI|nr:hypothetical protein HPB49_012528 [Dermacentor silvarum]